MIHMSEQLGGIPQQGDVANIGNNDPGFSEGVQHIKNGAASLVYGGMAAFFASERFSLPTRTVIGAGAAIVAFACFEFMAHNGGTLFTNRAPQDTEVPSAT